MIWMFSVIESLKITSNLLAPGLKSHFPSKEIMMSSYIWSSKNSTGEEFVCFGKINHYLISFNSITKFGFFILNFSHFPRFESCLEILETFGVICAIYKVASSALVLTEQLIMPPVIISDNTRATY